MSIVNNKIKSVKYFLTALVALFFLTGANFPVCALPAKKPVPGTLQALPRPKQEIGAAGPNEKAKKSFEDLKGGIAAVSDGNGRVRLLWLPRPGQWALGGFRVEETGSGKVLIAAVKPGEDKEAMSALSAEDRSNVTSLHEAFSGGLTKEDELVYFAMTARVSSEWAYARAAGFGVVLENLPAGPRSYQVTGLDKQGKALNIKLTSPAVDAAKPSNLPLPPTALNGVSGVGGVGLFWSPAEAKEKLYVTTYVVEREVAGQKPVLLTDHPRFYFKKWDPKKPAYVDTNAPLENEITYRVASVDAFGRKSSSAICKLFAVDIGAVMPPMLAVKAQAGSVALTWKASDNPNTAGYVLERSVLVKGPFEALTPKGLEADVTSYEDKNVIGGTAYYYRIRAVGPRGNTGEPGTARMALPRNKEKPPKPENLKAEVGRTAVHLTWDPVTFAVGGYVVERKVPGAARWMLLSLQARPEPFYDDIFPLHSSGKFSYRVTAVAYDNQQSEPSKTVDVTLLDTLAPNAPYILTIDGSNGKVSLTFKPAPPEEDIAQFLVVRGVSEEDQGLVIGDPLPANSRKFEDTFVKIGQRYWYRMAALDKAGNRSDLGEVRQVTVMNPPIPTPKKPGLKNIKEPAPYILITFDKAPDQHGVMIQRKTAGSDRWETIAGPVFEEIQVADINLPKEGKLQYRVVYQAINHVSGQPSEAAEIER
jgi:hypothetical protein